MHREDTWDDEEQGTKFEKDGGESFSRDGSREDGIEGANEAVEDTSGTSAAAEVEVTSEPLAVPEGELEKVAYEAFGDELDAGSESTEFRGGGIDGASADDLWARQNGGEVDLADMYLEEAFYPAKAGGELLGNGSLHTWGELGFVVEAPFGRGWYRAHTQGEGEPLLVRPGAQGTVWASLPSHRLLPSVRYSGPEGLVTAWLEGDPLQGPLPPEEMLDYGLALAQLLRFFEGQRQTVLYLEPESLLLTPTGLRLRLPPQLASLGEPLPSFYREGYTPPEVQTGTPASGKEGVYVLAALLLEMLTGSPPPPEGFGPLTLTAVKVPGMPQLLATAFAPAEERLDPAAFLGALRTLHRSMTQHPPAFEIAGATTVGLNPDRPVNEDSYGYLQEVRESDGHRLHLLRACVADGMGGEVAGEVASRAAVETFTGQTPSRPLDSTSAQNEWTTHLVWEANRAALEALSGREGGCTFTGVVVIGNQLSVAHVGDTRAYLYRSVENEGTFQALTQDHSLVRALVANGVLSEAEARNSPDRNKVLRSLGSLKQPQEGYVDDLRTVLPDLHDATMPLEFGDLLLLLSDGVWGDLEDGSLQAIVAAHAEDPRRLVNALIAEVLEVGASDNATAVAIRRMAQDKLKS